jgi:hypothetical protein
MENNARKDISACKFIRNCKVFRRWMENSSIWKVASLDVWKVASLDA